MDRYQPQIAQIGAEGQERLGQAHVLIVGVGALGSVAAELLCRAGVGALTLCDYDIVEEHNLHRQALYTQEDVGRQKAVAAAQRLRAINPGTRITTIMDPFDESTPLAGITLVIDGTDTLDARLLLNSRARKGSIPLIIGTASGTQGMVYAVTGSPCWQCIAQGKAASDDCDSGVLPMATHLVATLQSSAALRTMLGDPPQGLAVVDAWSPAVRTIAVQPNPACAVCNGTYARPAAALRWCAAVQRIQARLPHHIDLSQLQDTLQRYPSAVRVRVGTGTALVHRHGLVEFDGVPKEEAVRFVSQLEK